jgi:hypothetical protein
MIGRPFVSYRPRLFEVPEACRAVETDTRHV